jgi:hypothetical protein
MNISNLCRKKKKDDLSLTFSFLFLELCGSTARMSQKQKNIPMLYKSIRERKRTEPEPDDLGSVRVYGSSEF